MNDRELKWIGNGLVFYSFGFVMYGMDVMAGVCALFTILIVLYRFGVEKILAHWEFLVLTSIAELVLIERSGMAVSASALFVVSFADLIHAAMWCRYDYVRNDYQIYRLGLVICTVIALCSNCLPFGFLNTMLVIILVFMPYTLIGREQEKKRAILQKKQCRKKHLTVIE